MRVSRGVMGGGIGTVILVLAALYFGVDPSIILNSVPMTGPSVETRQQRPGPDPMREFVSVVLADTEKTWHEVFRRYGKTYAEPKLVLFSGAVQSAWASPRQRWGPSIAPRITGSTST